MTHIIRDFFITLNLSDADRLSIARLHNQRLEQFPAWSQQSDSPFLMRMGENLFHLGFPTDDDVSRFVDEFADAVAADAVLRVWLYADDPQVAMLPWEYLCLPSDVVDDCRRNGVDIEKYQPNTSMPDPRTFLALNPHISLVRQANPNLPEPELERIGALRVLIVWANPGCSHWSPISGVVTEISSILSKLGGLPNTHIEVRVVEHATKAELERVLREWRPHVLHFSGHGGFPQLDDPDNMPAPALVLEVKGKAKSRCHDYLTADELRALCAECGTQVVVLNCCWGARTSPHFTGIAHALITPTLPYSHTPIPAVIAHQMPIPQPAAVGFAVKLYQHIALACPVEEGVGTFRKDFVANHPYGCGVPEWGIPVVFLSVNDSALFRVEDPDPYPLNFGEIIKEHVPIVGRDFVRKRMEDFKRDNPSGIFLFVAPPGVGKTAFVAQMVDEDRDIVHFFFRATAGVTDPDECVKSLYRGLLGRWGILEENPTDDRLELRRRLHDWLLPQVSIRCQRAGRKEIIFIDALDEASEAGLDRQSVIEALSLKRKLPPHVYLFITSRPVPRADSLAQEAHITRFDLDPSSEDNQRDAVAYCLRELQGRVMDADDATLQRLSERLAQPAKGNFLVLKLFLSRDSLGETVSVFELERAAEFLTGTVEKAYEEFFERITRRIADDPDKLDLLYSVLGAFVTAQAPITLEQICAAFSLRVAQWHWALGLVSQFLERGGVRQEEQGALTYRLYHETFREFLLNKLAADIPHYHRLWAEHCANWRTLSGYDRLYALRHRLWHLLASERHSEALQVCRDEVFMSEWQERDANWWEQVWELIHEAHSKSPKLRFALLQILAKRGDPAAMHEYGLECDDPKERERWLRGAAEEGYIPAMYDYGLECDDSEEGERWLKEAAENGYIPAMYDYGLVCDDPVERKHWLKEAAENGYIPAMYDYGLVCDNPEERKLWLKKAAQAGYLPARDEITDAD